MRIIIDNDYSRHNFTRVTKKERKGGEGSVYLFSCLFLFLKLNSLRDIYWLVIMII